MNHKENDFNNGLKDARHQSMRQAGVLLHISSLPGDFGVGDFGPGAKQFIGFLESASQHYWQVLPLSITNKLNYFSPYSSHSAFAGNTMFIDPLQLSETGLLKKSGLNKARIKTRTRVNFELAAEGKNKIIREAYDSFLLQPPEKLHEDYQRFIKKEQFWLDDFALYECLFNYFNEQPWNLWPAEYRNRDHEKLSEFAQIHEYDFNLVRFAQFIFSRQWMQVKAYANAKGIKVFGDIPVYVDYNSADVWANPAFFHLNSDCSMKTVAGVPPDYFNENGQRWGMPIFNWSVLEKKHYSWWLRRIEKNLEWFDLLRLDHFRGFSAYWEIPADADTAIEGRWVQGPGESLFDAIRKKFPNMPFVAEDLGMIDQEVYDLRDKYELPGMKVLQFGFDEDSKTNEHHPVNIDNHSIVYTGTHDNNTLKGWYKRELDGRIRDALSDFHIKKITFENVHLEMIRIAYGSRAMLTIIPLQDWLGLGEESRMNYPSTTNGNWQWKIRRRMLSAKLTRRIRRITKTFNR